LQTPFRGIPVANRNEWGLKMIILSWYYEIFINIFYSIIICMSS